MADQEAGAHSGHESLMFELGKMGNEQIGLLSLPLALQLTIQPDA